MKVYISSPYTIGDKHENVLRQINAFHALAVNGFTPFAPTLSHYIDIIYPMDYDWWLKYDIEWLEQCDAVLRLDGESLGADKEVEHAKKLGIPVYYSLSEIVGKK